MTGTVLLLCALLYLALAVLALVRLGAGREGLALGAVSLATVAWAVTAAVAPDGQAGGAAAAAELARLSAWLLLLLLLLDRTLGREAQGRGLFAALCALACLSVPAALGPVLWPDGLASWGPDGAESWAALGAGPPSLAAPGVALRLVLCLGGLMLAETLLRNAEPEERWHVALPCIGVGVLLVFEVLLVSDAALFRRPSPVLLQGRPVVACLVAPVLALGAWRDGRLRGRASRGPEHDDGRDQAGDWGHDRERGGRAGARPLSRRAVLHTASLVLSGVFLVGLAGAGEVFRRLGADWGVVAEVSLVFAGVLALAMLLTSGSARGWMRVLLVDRLHAQRFDYGREWTRCIETLSADAGHVPLHERVLQAVCGIVDSPGGALFLRDEGGGEAGGAAGVLRWAGSWNQPPSMAAVPAGGAAEGVAPAAPVAARAGGWAWRAAMPGAADRDGDAPDGVVTAGVRRDAAPGTAGPPPSLGEALAADRVAPRAQVSGWPADLPDGWLAVPLRHGGRLLGAALVARPRALFPLDAEVEALLRVVGREGAAFLAEHRAAQELMETRELRHRAERFAFVAHDIKNLSSQLSLLLSNAERHMDDPEFRRDMLETIRNSVGKIRTTLARLQGPAPQGAELREPAAAAAFSPAGRLEALVEARRRLGQRVELELDGLDGACAMAPGGFDAAVGHLLDNAIEASAPGEAVRLELRHAGRRATLDVVDRGCGMTPEFVRDRLFRPFSSSKPQGHGIGAFQARSLLREAGGDLLVMSEAGRGTTMRLVLPLLAECRRVAA